MATKEEKEALKKEQKELKRELKEEKKEEKNAREEKVTEFKIKVVPPVNMDDFSRECIKSHNIYRKSHQAPPIYLDVGMGKEAMHWATVSSIDIYHVFPC